MGFFDNPVQAVSNVVKNPASAVGHLWGGSAGGGLLQAGQLLTGKNPFNSLLGIPEEMGGEIPGRAVTNLDPKTRALMEDTAFRSQLTPETFARERMMGVKDAARGVIPQEGSIEASLGMAPVSQAVSNRASQIFGRELGGLENQASVQGVQDKSNAINRAFIQQATAQKVQLGVNQRLMEAQTNQEAARSNAIKSVLGLAGTVVGGMMGMPSAGGGLGQQTPYHKSGTAGDSNLHTGNIA